MAGMLLLLGIILFHSRINGTESSHFSSASPISAAVAGDYVAQDIIQDSRNISRYPDYMKNPDDYLLRFTYDLGHDNKPIFITQN
jgi:hypothetical protein